MIGQQIQGQPFSLTRSNRPFLRSFRTGGQSWAEAVDFYRCLLKARDVAPLGPRDASLIQFLFKVLEIGIH
jgi:hypothetical protein